MRRHFMTALVVGFAMGSAAVAMTGGRSQDRPTPAATPPSLARNDYSRSEAWLCRPDRQDACAIDLTSTVVAANGKLTRERWTANPKAPIDCFYVYPTVSNDPTPNSDMIAGDGENGAVREQFARFASQCRVYAPLYRQATLTSLLAQLAGKPMAVDPLLPYNDVLDAWNHYLGYDNGGRGVVLIGHSQGSVVLTRLVHDEIDGKPMQSRVVSALLLGWNVPVPRGKDVGGAFQHLPLCRSAKQTGCVITYAAFRSNVPPPADSLFGRVPGENMVAGCTNPAALAGGSGQLHSYLSARAVVLPGFAAEQPPWVTTSQPINTPFVSVPGLLTAECVSNEKGSYLEVKVHGDPSDHRTDEIAGDVVANGQVQANFGLHLIDVNLAMGNLVDIVGLQSKSYLATRRGR